MSSFAEHLIRRRAAVITHDLFMVWLAWMLAYLVRYSLWPDAPRVALLSRELLLVMSVQFLVFWWTGLYRGLWRFASLPDLWNIIRAAVVGTLSISLALFLANRLQGTPRSVLLMYPLALMVLLSAPRLVYRWWKDHGLSFADSRRKRRVLVIGAGKAGEMLVRDLHREGEYLVVGLLDDNARLHGVRVRDVPVLGPVSDLARHARSLEAELAIIAVPSADAGIMRSLVEACEEAGLPFRTLPRLQDIVSGQASVSQLRRVRIDDLLGRSPVTLDWAAIEGGLAGRRVLVTGAGGSIGSELCSQIARIGPASIVTLDHSEIHLYQIDRLLAERFPGVTRVAVLGDAGDRATVDHLMLEHRPQVVFHAAAYKQVPLLEGSAREAVRNNVLATATLSRCAVAHDVETFVLISTDKAVNSVSVMGASKYLAERVCEASGQGAATRFMSVRFGNVLDSAGSVVPLFRKQIAAGGPVTVTHEEMTRFFMTIPEACQLIMQAAVMGSGGEVYVLDMGEPIAIRFLAEQMIRLAGKRPGEDIEIVYTGLRPGEKLHEQLFHEHETPVATAHEKIHLARQSTVDRQFLERLLTELTRAVDGYDEDTLRGVLATCAPSGGGHEPTAAPTSAAAER